MIIMHDTNFIIIHYYSMYQKNYYNKVYKFLLNYYLLINNLCSSFPGLAKPIAEFDTNL